jgi:hypothetical protein
LKALFKNRLENLEKRLSVNLIRKKSALILCDAELPLDFCDFKVDAEIVLIVPDNSYRGPGKTATKGGYSVYYS